MTLPFPHLRCEEGGKQGRGWRAQAPGWGVECRELAGKHGWGLGTHLCLLYTGKTTARLLLPQVKILSRCRPAHLLPSPLQLTFPWLPPSLLSQGLSHPWPHQGGGPQHICFYSWIFNLSYCFDFFPQHINTFISLPSFRASFSNLHLALYLGFLSSWRLAGTLHCLTSPSATLAARLLFPPLCWHAVVRAAQWTNQMVTFLAFPLSTFVRLWPHANSILEIPPFLSPCDISFSWLLPTSLKTSQHPSWDSLYPPHWGPWKFYACPFALVTHPPMAVIVICMTKTTKSGIFIPELISWAPDCGSCCPQDSSTWKWVSNSLHDPAPISRRCSIPVFQAQRVFLNPTTYLLPASHWSPATIRLPCLVNLNPCCHCLCVAVSSILLSPPSDWSPHLQPCLPPTHQSYSSCISKQPRLCEETSKAFLLPTRPEKLACCAPGLLSHPIPYQKAASCPCPTHTQSCFSVLSPARSLWLLSLCIHCPCAVTVPSPFFIQRLPTLYVLQDFARFTCFWKPILMPPVPCSDPCPWSILPPPGASNTALLTLDYSIHLSVSPTKTVQVLEAKTTYFSVLPACGPVPAI